MTANNDTCAAFWRLLFFYANYRTPMPIAEVVAFCRAQGKTEYYYVCPRCRMTMEREFTAFCDRCGQRLDWRGYRNAAVIYPGQPPEKP